MMSCTGARRILPQSWKMTVGNIRAPLSTNQILALFSLFLIFCSVFFDGCEHDGLCCLVPHDFSDLQQYFMKLLLQRVIVMLALLFLLASSSVSRTHAFTATPPSFVAPALPSAATQRPHPRLLVTSTRRIIQAAAGVPEYSEFEDDDEGLPLEESSTRSRSAAASTDVLPPPTTIPLDDDDDEDAAPALPIETTTRSLSQQTSSHQTTNPHYSYAALEPGTVIQIQIGDLSVARKAWKKRRRNASPLLVPCSILSTDRISQIRWNLIYLLHKFGTSSTNNKKVRLSVAELAQRHRSHLGSSLREHAVWAGCDSPQQFVQEVLLNAAAQEAYGVRLVRVEGEEGGESSSHGDYLEAPLSRRRAQKRAAAAAVLQFAFSDNVDRGDDADDGDAVKPTFLQHTGWVRNRRPKDDSDSSSNYYQLQPLSAALRVGQADVAQIPTGSRHAAVVFEYDVQGDAGSPLLTLTLNPSRNQVRDRLKNKNKSLSSRGGRSTTTTNKAAAKAVPPLYKLKELSIGDSLEGAVIVRLVKGGALVDCGVRRGNDDDAVLGLLRFKDAVLNHNNQDEQAPPVVVWDEEEEEEEDWDEILSLDDLDLGDEEEEEDDDDEAEVHNDNASDPLKDVIAKIESEDDDFVDSEDITNHFQQNEDGSLTYTDPETGKQEIISNTIDDDEEQEEEVQKDVKAAGRKAKPSSFGYKEFEKALGALGARKPIISGPDYRTETLRVGERVDVYVKSVSKQSNQFTLTMDSSVIGKTAKDIKKESEVDKKHFRLAKQLGGFRRIRELKGKKCDGIIKAASNTGDWFYVQPQLDNLPVGVATVPETIEGDALQIGDAVRIRLDGVDKDRGQLAIRILNKL